MDRTHNPEFTVLEIVAYKDYFWMMNFTEQLVERSSPGITRYNQGENR